MAEIPFADYGDDDSGLNSDYFNGADEEYGFEEVETQETIIPIDKLEQYALSDNSYTRQLVASGLLEALRNANEANDRAVVFETLCKLTQDEEPSVRAEIVDHIPHISDYCYSHSSEVPGLTEALSSAILPSLVRCLHDNDNQVRKTAQSALIILLENRMIDQVDIEELICPVLMGLFFPETMPEEHRAEAISLMVRVSSLVNHNVVENMFLPKFCELCSESMFHIRKVCATSIGEMCRVAGPELAEKFLLPKFFNLCEDGIWGVRKACTECFMEVSNSLSPNARKTELAQLYASLLCDQSRWVRMSAFQALGPFISTFANPNTTGLYFDEDGILRVQQPAPVEGQQKGLVPTAPVESATSPAETVASSDPVGGQEVTSTDEDVHTSSNSSGETDSNSQPVTQLTNTEEKTSLGKESGSDNANVSKEVTFEQPSSGGQLQQPAVGESEPNKVDEFGSFKYWREPVPTLDLDSILQEVRQQDDSNSAAVTSEDPSQQQKSALRTTEENLKALATSLEDGIPISTGNAIQAQQQSSSQVSTFVFGPSSSPVSAGTFTAMPPPTTYASILTGNSLTATAKRSKKLSGESSGYESSGSLWELMAKQQDIIPHLLLENYLSMTDPSRAQTVDTDIAQHCAYSLPAVAYTLGKENWKCLRSLYETLVSDMQWKVRRTLAFSIHELAIILGSELTHSDLIPIFDDFIKDLDEVRVGVLSHLSDFLKLLNKESRRSYLPKIKEFLETDNNRVWRTRLDLAMQLVKLCPLFTCSEVVEHILPIAMKLLSDRISDVRQAALPLLSSILNLLKEPEQDQQRLMLINDLIEKLALSEKWHARQIYVQGCHRILKDHSIKSDQFSKELLPSIITLSIDKTPNVRISVAKLLSQELLHSDYFTGSQNPHHDDLMNAETKLKADVDSDVRYFANLPTEKLEQVSV